MRESASKLSQTASLSGQALPIGRLPSQPSGQDYPYMSVHFSESEGRLVAERVEPADEAACLPGPADPSDEVVAFEFAVAEVNGEYAPRRCRPRVADARLVLLPDVADGDGCVARNGGGALATGHRGESARVLHRAANYSHRICRESIFQRTRGCAEISWTMRSGGDAGENAHMRADLGESVTVALAWNHGPLFVQPGPPMACRHPPLVAPPGGWQETQVFTAKWRPDRTRSISTPRTVEASGFVLSVSSTRAWRRLSTTATQREPYGRRYRP